MTFNLKAGDDIEVKSGISMRITNVTPGLYVALRHGYRYYYTKDGILITSDHPNHPHGSEKSPLNFKRNSYKFMVHYSTPNYPSKGFFDDNWYDDLKCQNHANPGSKVIVLKNNDLSTLTVMDIDEARKLSA